MQVFPHQFLQRDQSQAMSDKTEITVYNTKYNLTNYSWK